MKIDVIAADIEKSKSNPFDFPLCEHCPIAQSLHRMGYKNATVGARTISLDGDERVRLPLPEIARKFINRFDSFHIAEPFSFEVPDILPKRGM